MLLSFNVFGGGPSNTQVPVLPDQKKNKQKKTRKSGTNIEVDVVVAQSNTRSIIGRHSKRRTVLALGRSVRLIEFFFFVVVGFSEMISLFLFFYSTGERGKQNDNSRCRC